MEMQINKIIEKAENWYQNSQTYIKLCVWMMLIFLACNMCYDIGTMFGKFLYNVLH